MNKNKYLVYMIQSGTSHIKLGYSHDVEKRIRVMQTGNPDKLRLLAALPVDDKEEAINLEKFLHLCFEKKCIHGEWFDKQIIPHIPEKLKKYYKRKDSRVRSKDIRENIVEFRLAQNISK